VCESPSRCRKPQIQKSVNYANASKNDVMMDRLNNLIFAQGFS
jgi:hypothetical protein